MINGEQQRIKILQKVYKCQFKNGAQSKQLVNCFRICAHSDIVAVVVCALYCFYGLAEARREQSRR